LARGPQLHPVWLAVFLFFTALFSVNGSGFARYIRSAGSDVQEIWQVLPGVGSALLLRALLT
jgi:hypothetical protein